MKPHLTRIMNSAFLLLAGSLLFTACKKGHEGGGTPADNTLSAVLKNHPEMSTLFSAMQRTGMDTMLAHKAETYTIFVPNNDAFSAAGISTSTINTMDINQLQRLIKYHILQKNMAATQFPISDTVKSMADTLNLFMSLNPNGSFVNGEKIISTDIHADNGSIHVIDGVLLPPTKTLGQIVKETPRFSLVYSALLKSGFILRVVDRAKFSFFVPDDNAMNASGWNAAKIDASTAQEVTDLLKHHVTITNTFSTDFYDNSYIYSFQAGTVLLINKTPIGLKLDGSTASPSKVITTTRGTTYDVVATNGVLHEIDKVIL